MSHQIISTFGWSIVHFLWQGAVIGLLAAGLLECLRRRSSEVRYLVAGCALAACILAFIATFFLMLPPKPTTTSFVASDLILTAPLVDSYAPTTATRAPAPDGSRTTDISQAVVWCWLLGVLLMSCRFSWQCLAAHHLKTRNISEPDSPWLAILQGFRQELGISRRVRMLVSSVAEVPMVLGWLSPVILIPASAFTSLTPDQLRSILAHELSHIRRHDHLINFLQGVIEVILFYHPTVWWLSQRVRVEREHCCDDLSIRTTGNPRLLAEALTRLESLRLTTSKTISNSALGATGGPLMSRITRILEHETTDTRPSIRWRGPIALSLGALIAASFIGNVVSNANAAEVAPYTAVQEDARQERTTGPVNTTCPITGREVNNDSPTVEVRDYTVAFCCNNCVAKFNENPREYLTSMREAGVFNQESRGNERPNRRRESADDVNLKIGRILIDLGTAVESGEISAEDAMKRIAGLAQRMNMGKKEKKKTITKADYAEAVEKMTEMVKAGKITRQQMQERLDGMRREMTGASRTRTISREEYAEAQRKMQAMVEKGEISEEDMKRRLGEMRKMIGRNNTDGEASKEEYMERIGERLKAAVESGKMTRAEAREKFNEMEKEYDPRSSSKDGEKTKVLTRRDYAEAQAKMQKMVDNGEITEEDMNKRLAEMRSAIAEQNGRKRE